MKCIALEPATTAPSLALVEDAQILREVSLPSGREQGGAIFSILREWRADFERLDCWAVGLGPGSFTGIRAAIATMQGLNFPFRKPIYGVNSHDAVALEPLPPEDEFGTGDARHMCVVSDARRDEIYVTIYERENEAWRPYRDTHIVSIDALAAETAMMPRFFSPARPWGNSAPISPWFSATARNLRRRRFFQRLGEPRKSPWRCTGAKEWHARISNPSICAQCLL
ncbi:tRNA (adenosine(37)-N6)-threonylcarbamoyltransferase complex dimerization subunit type 1 TsaB [Kamptonema cortianum]|nr:tRNA (adenosine(37)-N6)-threonylcarbamoyltransferase complex dimerization subunit type 1 TsaB [Kamptonema cortianum]